MAEITTQNQAGRVGDKVRAKKMSTKIDMTPMVDLAFLLLTFFILTATLAENRVLKVTMPEPAKDPAQVPLLRAENALNVVLAEGDTIFYWTGFDRAVSATNYSRTGIRKILLEYTRANPDLMVLIKPMDGSRYQNIVDLLDEADITRVPRYAIVKFTADDAAHITAIQPGTKP